jgi:hypothetical protein
MSRRLRWALPAPYAPTGAEFQHQGQPVAAQPAAFYEQTRGSQRPQLDGLRHRLVVRGTTNQSDLD